jgi:hypothetical protein
MEDCFIRRTSTLNHFLRFCMGVRRERKGKALKGLRRNIDE